MIDINCTPNPQFVAKVQKKERAALFRIGAYVRGVARRKVKVVKKKDKHGPAGGAWVAHTPKAKDAITYEVDENRNSVTVGLRRLSDGPTNAEGQPVSEILEHGGAPAEVSQGYWQYRHELKDAYRQSHDMAQAVFAVYSVKPTTKRYRSAPAFWGQTRDAAIAARAKASKKRFGNMRYGNISRRAAYEIKSNVLGKKIWYAPVKVTTFRQAQKVAATIIRTQGVPYEFGKKRQEPRPLMAISYKESKQKIGQIITQAFGGGGVKNYPDNPLPPYPHLPY